MALENVMRVDNGNIVTGGGAGGNSVEIDWEDWCKLTPEEQETGDWTIINCPWADGNISVDLMTKLWENPSPTASFAAQTVALSDMNYDLYFTVFRVTSDEWYATYILDTKTSGKNWVESLNSAMTTLYNRGLKVVSNGISFDDARVGSTANNSYMIPYRIYGIKLTASVKINAIAMDVSTSADKCMLSENESVKDRLDELALNTFGTYETITSYTVANPYVCQHDGYVRLSIQQNGKGYINVNGFALAGSEYIVSYQLWSVFVRKGSKLAISSNTNAILMFFPIIESV